MSELLPAGPHCSRWIYVGGLQMFCYPRWVSEENDNKDCRYRSSQGGDSKDDRKDLGGSLLG